MRALLIDGYAAVPSAHLGTAADARPGPGEVSIRVEAAALNPLDAKLAPGDMTGWFPLTFPYVPGTDFAGVIDALSEDVTDLNLGDAVLGRSEPVVGGALAEAVVVPARSVIRRPEGLDAVTTACLLTPAGIAHQALFDHLRVSKGAVLLILGAGGAVGRARIQLAPAGVEIVACAGRPHGTDLASPARWVRPDEPDFLRVAAEADCVLDCTGGQSSAGSSRRCVRAPSSPPSLRPRTRRPLSLGASRLPSSSWRRAGIRSPPLPMPRQGVSCIRRPRPSSASREEDVARLFDEAAARFGVLDVLVNNAGVMSPMPLAELDGSAFDRLMAINVRGVVNGCRQACARLRDGGRIVNLSTSVLAMAPAGYGPYCASKAAVEALTRCLAKELAARSITVNAVAPGPTETELLIAANSADRLEGYARMTPLGRLGQPDDIAGVAAFLAGPEASWVTGQVIRANGGMA